MKYFKFLVIFLAILIIPFSVLAEDEENAAGADTEETAETSEDSKKVPIYFFRGEGCSHCAEAEEWFKSIEEEYGSFFEVKDYETWYNEENADLMQQIAELRDETADGVPYIIIGNKSWNGFADDYKNEMLEEIKSVFEQNIDDRYDIMNYLKNSSKKEEKKDSSSDIAALIIIIVVVGLVGFGIFKARQSTN